MEISELDERTHLLNTKISMPSSDSLPEFVRQGIQHGMMRMYARQSVLVQLLGDNRHQFLHSSFVVRPIAYYLQTMRQIAVGVRKIWLQLQRCSVRLYCFGNVAGIFMDRCQIGMSVGEGWIDLYSSCVALQSSLYVLHLFERVSHVRVSIGEGWLYANRFFVMHQSLI